MKGRAFILLAFAAPCLAQFKETPPAPYPVAVAREKIKTIIAQADPANPQDSVKALTALLTWYRELIDEELIAAWRTGNRAALPPVIEALADPAIAKAVVDFSWHEGRSATFNLTNAPMLGHLMARYRESAQPFLRDLLPAVGASQPMPVLSQAQIEAVCRILIDMPDTGTWKKDGLTILIRYRQTAQNLLEQDLVSADRDKRDNARVWAGVLAKPASAPPAPAATYRVGGTVSAPAVLVKSDPEYSEVARKLGAEGSVLLSVVVDASGIARDVRVVRPLGYGLDEKAIEAVSKWRFRPGMKAGAPVGTRAQIEVNFRLLKGGKADREWSPGPMIFALEPDEAPPVVQAGARPPAMKEAANESVVLDFTVDATGFVKDVHIMYGSPASAALLTRTLAAWRFSPAVRGGRRIEATGRVRFILGNGGSAAADALVAPTLYGNSLSAPAPPVPVTAPAATSSPSVLSRTQPEVTEVARKLRVQGVVGLSVLTAPDGSARDVYVVRPLGYGLDEKAAEAVRHWRFQPGETHVEVNIPFPPGGLAENNVWHPGELTFAPEDGLAFPAIRDGPAPRAIGAPPDAPSAAFQSAVFEFTVLKTGGVRDIRVVEGTEAAYNQIARDLAAWVFRPAMKNGAPEEATARLRLVLGPPNFNSGPPLAAPSPRAAAPAPARADALLFVVRPGKAVNERDGLTYVWIAPGSFTMGCSEGDTECYSGETPQPATVANGFWMASTLVTQTAWRKVMGSDPSYFKGRELPVERVAWSDAVNYCGAVGGRLPGDIEWEYAARAAAKLSRYGNLDEIAWHSGNSANRTHPVAAKQPNAFGLYDMLGNVWEWIADDAPGDETRKVLRGGAYDRPTREARLSSRGRELAALSFPNIGFRCAVDGAATGDRFVYRAGQGGVSQPRVLKQVRPAYSPEAQNAKINGTVVLEVTIDTAGAVADARVTTSLGHGLDEKAIEAIRQWRFAPAQKDGKAVAAITGVELVFRVD